MITLRTRILNFAIDSFAFLLIAVAMGLIVRDTVPRDHFKWIMIAAYYLYYFVCEAFTGKTVGKYITNSIVVDAFTDGQATPKQVLYRTLLRMIPIDGFSYLFSAQGMHDNFSKTKLKYN